MLITREIHIQVACDRTKNFSGWTFSGNLSNTSDKRLWTGFGTELRVSFARTIWIILGCSACNMDGPRLKSEEADVKIPELAAELKIPDLWLIVSCGAENTYVVIGSWGADNTDWHVVSRGAKNTDVVSRGAENTDRFECMQNSVSTFVLRGCDSISLVPYVPGPILATICCTRVS